MKDVITKSLTKKCVENETRKSNMIRDQKWNLIIADTPRS